MEIKQARKILGKEALNVSDKDLERDIRCAELLKDLFFNEIMRKKKNLPLSCQSFPNVP